MPNAISFQNAINGGVKALSIAWINFVYAETINMERDLDIFFSGDCLLMYGVDSDIDMLTASVELERRRNGYSSNLVASSINPMDVFMRCKPLRFEYVRCF